MNQSYKTVITTAELAIHLDNPAWVIVDCRFDLTKPTYGRHAYQQAHIPNAVYAHLDDDLSGPIITGQTGRHPLPDVTTFAQILSAWGIDSTVQVVAYDDKGGAIAARLWWMLRWLGHEAAAVLDGGWLRWVAEGRPAKTGEESSVLRQFIPQPQPHLLVELAEMQANYAHPTFHLFDARAAARYHGTHEPLDPIAGHIPTAVSAPFAENLAEDGGFHPSDHLRARFEQLLGDIPTNEAVFYCGSGVTAAHNALAVAHAGLGDVRVYAGSWSEWITQPNPPVEQG